MHTSAGRTVYTIGRVLIGRLRMEAGGPAETLLTIYQTIRRHIPEHSHRQEKIENPTQLKHNLQ
jgi:hypothetical protein